MGRNTADPGDPYVGVNRPPLRSVDDDTGPATHSVMFRTPDGEQTTVEVEEDQYLLFAALDAGLDLPSTCLQGWCTACAGRLVKGDVEIDVDQSEAFRYFEEDAEKSFVLLCSAHPKGDLVIETHQKAALREHREQHGRPVPRG